MKVLFFVSFNDFYFFTGISSLFPLLLHDTLKQQGLFVLWFPLCFMWRWQSQHLGLTISITLVSYGCQNKTLQTGWLKTTEIWWSQFWSLEVWSQSISKAMLSLITLEANPSLFFQLLVYASDPWHSLASRCITLVTWLPSPCVSLHIIFPQCMPVSNVLWVRPLPYLFFRGPTAPPLSLLGQGDRMVTRIWREDSSVKGLPEKAVASLKGVRSSRWPSREGNT